MTRTLLTITLVALIGSWAAAEPRATRKAGKGKIAHPLIGVWESEAGVIVFEENRLFIGADNPKSAMLVGEYGVTRDNIIYGIITQEKVTGDMFPLVSFVDETFRFRLEGDQLTIKDVSISFPRLLGGNFLALGLGKLAGASKKAADKESSEILTEITGTLLIFQIALQKTYQKTTREKLAKDRQNPYGLPAAGQTTPPYPNAPGASKGSTAPPTRPTTNPPDVVPPPPFSTGTSPSTVPTTKPPMAQPPQIPKVEKKR